MPRLVIQTPGKGQSIYELVKERVTLGREAGNDLVLPDINISRLHAVLEHTPEGYRISDQKSRNGVLVDDQRCTEALLKEGSVVRLGGTTLRFEDATGQWASATMHTSGITTSPLLPVSNKQHLRQATEAIRSAGRLPEGVPPSETELEKKLREAERRSLLFEVLISTHRALRKAAGPEAVLEEIPRLVLAATDAERALVMLWDEEKGCLRQGEVLAASGDKVEYTDLALSSTLLNTVLKSRQGVLIRDAVIDPRLAGTGSVIAKGLRSAIVAPMTAQDRLFGLVYADSRRRSQIFHEDDLEVLSILAREAAMVLEGARIQEELLKQERVRLVYRRFLPDQVADLMVANPEAVRLGGTRREVTALFADLRGFTSLSETLPPEQAVELLNSFFTEMAATIFRHGGTLNKFLGDGLLAIFGAPLSSPDDPLRAVRCAMEMQKELTVLSAENLRQGRPAIPMGIGINSGEVIAGNIGSAERMEYTVIGDTVNVAARLTAKAGPGEILLGQSTWKHVESQLAAEPLPPMELKGKREPVAVYRISGPA